MAKRIVQIANELNIATTTVVDFLQKKGFEVDPTPQTKLSDDMERSLMQEFSSSQAIKVEADKITLGSSRPEKKETPSLNTLRPSAPKLTGLTVTGKIDLSPATKPIVTEKPKPVEQSSKPVEIKPTVIEPKPVAKEERKAEGASSFDDMIAYVDENGNLSASPPDPTKKKKVTCDGR